MKADCREASVAFFGVLGFQVWAVPGREFEGVSVFAQGGRVSSTR